MTMKLYVIHILFLLLTSLSSTIAGSIHDTAYERHESDKQVNGLSDEHVELKARSTQIVVPLVIAGLAISTAVVRQILHTIKTKPQATIEPPSNDKEVHGHFSYNIIQI
ncbi:hypothetical protein CPB84DRAFT_1744475 [Gymnopilus junonius]|uniref:Uncharacterized protein n=1 Tax=Gymnopilus junonius TaxID=109634 RepID=A0A9P5TQR9_GYMJU|nr:hypothetical protein CPB84DRAFT_1744475 [Gymnopilus junonius]